MGSDDGHRQGTESDGATDNVVRFPGDWIGPLEDLVPIGPAADRAAAAKREAADRAAAQREAADRAAAAKRETADSAAASLSGADGRASGRADVNRNVPSTARTLSADAFWGEEAESLHEVLQAPRAVQPSFEPVAPPLGDEGSDPSTARPALVREPRWRVPLPRRRTRAPRERVREPTARIRGLRRGARGSGGRLPALGILAFALVLLAVAPLLASALEHRTRAREMARIAGTGNHGSRSSRSASGAAHTRLPSASAAVSVSGSAGGRARRGKAHVPGRTSHAARRVRSSGRARTTSAGSVPSSAGSSSTVSSPTVSSSAGSGGTQSFSSPRTYTGTTASSPARSTAPAQSATSGGSSVSAGGTVASSGSSQSGSAATGSSHIYSESPLPVPGEPPAP